jgi:hypothetical protein
MGKGPATGEAYSKLEKIKYSIKTVNSQQQKSEWLKCVFVPTINVTEKLCCLHADGIK